MNSKLVQAGIHRLIESCRTPRGGFTRRFIDLVGVKYEPPFNLPAGWKRRLIQHGDADAIKVAVEQYLSLPVDKKTRRTAGNKLPLSGVTPVMAVGDTTYATLHFDGACYPNPGPASCGYIIKSGEDVLAKASVDLGNGTNNIAEYEGLIRGLDAALKLGISRLQVYGDSQLVIFRISGKWKKQPVPHLRPLLARAKALASRFEDVQFHWIRRELNTEADAMSTQITDREQEVEYAARDMGLTYSI